MISFLHMKNFRMLIMVATLMAMVGSASAQSKIASVDMKKLFNGYYKTRMAQSALEKKKSDLRKEIKDMADGLDKGKAEYKEDLEQADDQAISADERDRRKLVATQKAKDVNDSQAAIEQFQRQAEAQLSEQSTRMSGNLVTDIQKAVAEKAQSGGYAVVVNSSNPEAVVYANPDNDITEAVLTQLNAGAPIDVTKPADAAPSSPSLRTP
jgi:outer membrane protein